MYGKMDILPIKFRTPPPKPPRRRHSDQLSALSGTFPSSKRNFLDETSYYNNKYSLENSSCGSLPANWNKIENVQLFFEQDYSNENTRSFIHDKCELKKCFLEGNKKNFTCNIPLQKNSSKQLIMKKSETPSCVVSKEFFSFDDITKHLHKYLHKESHRRHNSDPLPFNIDCHSLTSFSTVLSVDNNRKSELFRANENQCLLQEIKSLKDINNKLWEQLCRIQASGENLKNCLPECSKVLTVSDLLMGVYDSLRAKDSAMEDRMKTILQERENAVKDLDRMAHVVAKSFGDKYLCSGDKSSDDEIKELLKEVEVTCNPGKLLQQQRLLLSYLYRSKELKLDHMAAEKNSLKLKIHLLENEMKQLKLSHEIWNKDHKLWESSLLNVLCQVIQQSDKASISYNAHTMEYFNYRSAVQEKSLNSDCFQRLEGMKNKIFPPNKIENPISTKIRWNEIKHLREEILMLSASLEMEISKRKCAEDKCLRLERLVTVLQKKLIGHNVGIPV